MIIVLRFLAGETSLQGIMTSGLSDTWEAVESNQDKNGFTFNVLDNEPVKRVRLDRATKLVTKVISNYCVYISQIDYIFMSQSDPLVAHVIETDVVNSDKYW